MPMATGMFTSERLDWQTPVAVYKKLNAEFHFDCDPCPPNNLFNGLSMEWGGSNFVNPPYGREIPGWIDKAIEEHRKGKSIVLLVPSRTDTKWWHRLMDEAPEIRFIRGRLKFDDQKSNAPFPSAIVILRGK